MSQRKDSGSSGEGGEGGRREVFPVTRWTWIDGARNDDEKYAELLMAYYRPMEVHMGFLASRYRLREEPRELVHDFLSKRGWVEKESLGRVRRGVGGGRFRSFIKACLTNFVVEKLRRGGRVVSESELPSGELPEGEEAPADPDAVDVEFALAVWSRCTEAIASAFERKRRQWFYEKIRPCVESHANAPSYAEVARELAELGKVYEENAIKQAVFKTRAALRAALIREVEKLTQDPEQAEEEARHLLQLAGRSGVWAQAGDDGLEQPSRAGELEIGD